MRILQVAFLLLFNNHNMFEELTQTTKYDEHVV